MPEAPRAFYPLLGRGRHRGKRRRLGRTIGRTGGRSGRLIAVAVLALVALAATMVALRLPARPDRDAARVAFAEAQRTLAAGNYSATRANAARAAAADPGWPIPQLLLARADLALGDGIAAEGALARARTAGTLPENLHHLVAEAAYLQGDPDRALDEATLAPARYRAAADRVRALALAAADDLPGARALLGERLAAAPGDVDAWIALGRVRFGSGDVGGAADAASRALSLDRRRPDAMLLEGEIVRTRYGGTASLPWFDAALARDAYHHDALIERAATLGDLGRSTDALADTRAALAARPGSPQAYYLQAVIAARAGRLDLSRTLLARGGAGLADLPGAMLLAGSLDYATGRLERAIGAWRALLGVQPTNLVARRLLGAALLRSGDPRGSLEILRPLALRADADPYTLSLVARAFERGGERDWAARFLDHAASPVGGDSTAFSADASVPVLADDAAPGNPAAAVALVRGLIEAGNLSAALARAQTLGSASPGSPAAQLVLGDVLVAAGRLPDATRAYARAADLAFDEPTMLRLVDAYDRTGRGRDAARALALFLQQNPENVAARRLLAARLLAARDWTGAGAVLEGLRARLGSGDAALLADLALAHAGRHLGRGDGAVARRYGRAAWRLAPMNPAVADAYGWALYAAGEIPASLPLLRQAAMAAPVHAGIHWHLAQALADAGRGAEARAAIAVALADPHFPDRAPAAALLATLR